MTTPGFFEIYPAARPALPAGTYELETDQTLTAQPTEGPDVDVDVPATDVHFRVLAPRYTLPPEQLLSTFPPAGAVGDWSQRLPQLVCKRRTLPWERNPGSGEPEDAPPWLALVVLEQGEGALSGDVSIAECTTSRTPLAGDSDTQRGQYLEVTDKVVRAVFPTEQDLSRLAHVRKVDLEDTELALGDDDGYMAVLMANRLPQPGPPAEPGGPPTSRKYTAYLVNVEEQLDALPDDDPTDVESDFSILVAGLITPMLLAAAPAAQADDIVMKPDRNTVRLPTDALNSTTERPAGAADDAATRRGQVTAADAGAASGRGYGSHAHHSVEAEWSTGPTSSTAAGGSATVQAKNWKVGDVLAQHAELADKFDWHDFEKRYRFPVLLSWDFVCTGTGTFESFMNELDTAMLGTVDDDDLGTDVGPTGHVALEHTTRRGEAATAWYRGPLVPLPTERTGADPDGTIPIAHSADEIRPVVPDGREDMSRAAAFEIGRLLALSKPGIVAAMMRWREELFGASRAATVADQIARLPGAADALTTGGRRLEELLAKELILPYAENAGARLPPVAPDVRIARPPEILSNVEPDRVLIGLGLDVADVDAVVREFGLAGLGELAPNLDDTVVPRVSREPAVAGRMRDTIETRVATRAAEALRLDATGRSTPTAGTDRDVLDELISGDSELRGRNER